MVIADIDGKKLGSYFVVACLFCLLIGVFIGIFLGHNFFKEEIDCDCSEDYREGYKYGNNNCIGLGSQTLCKQVQDCVRLKCITKEDIENERKNNTSYS